MLAALIALNAITALVCLVMLALLLKRAAPAETASIAGDLARIREESRAALDAIAHADRERLDRLQSQLDTTRQFVAAAIKTSDATALRKLSDLGRSQQEQMHALTAFVADSLNRLAQSSDTRLTAVEKALDALRTQRG